MWLRNIWILYRKEFQRLKHNPAALMAVGLLILMAILVNIETNSIQQAKVSAQKYPCVVVFDQTYPLINYLKKQKKTQNIRFFKTQRLEGKKQIVQYPKKTDCAAEISFNTGRPDRLNIIFRTTDITGKQQKLNRFSNWLLSNASAFYSGFNVNQQVRPLLSKNPIKKTNAGIDLGNAKSKSMVSAMLLYSTEFFICCALFISLSANEKELGVLQAVALTTASSWQILVAKYAFHLTLSIIASLIMVFVLSEYPFAGTLVICSLYLPAIILTSLCLISIASMVVSFNKTQTAASLSGFCYLMLVGVVMALANSFKGFAMLKEWMFESHSIQLYGLIFQLRHLKETAYFYISFHFASLMILTVLLISIATFVWNRYACKNH